MKHYYIPEGFNFDLLLNSCGYERFSNQTFRERCYYLIDSLYLERVIKEESWEEYFPRHSKSLEAVLTARGAFNVKKILTRLGIIEVKTEKGREVYIPGQRSKSYRIGRRYWNARFCRVEAQDKGLANRIEKERIRSNLKVASNHPGKSLIYSSLCNIEFDLEGAKRLYDEMEFDSPDKRASWQSSISRMGSRCFRICSDPRGRVYHSLTNMPRRLRQFLRYSGEVLYMVDVSSSHPCLLSSLYPEPCEEKERYDDIVKAGRFYSFLNSRIESPFDLEDREQALALKEAVLHQILYSSNYGPSSPLKEAFRLQFPRLAELIRYEKRIHQRYFAYKIQKLEAEIVINAAATKFAERHGERACLISIHDCFLTTEVYAAEVEELLKDAYEQRLGFRPNIRSERI